MRRWAVYHLLTWLDIYRLWHSVQVHVIIVAGICLPILLLLGLKNGHVAELREKLVKSPTGREIVVWIANRGKIFSQENLQGYKKDIYGIELLIPSVQRLVKISNVDAGGNEQVLEALTLLSTDIGDPILNQFEADVLGQANDPIRTIILASNVAEHLYVKVGETVNVTVSRSRGSVDEQATVEMVVGGLIEPGEQETNEVAYASVETLLAMERYVMGFQVKQFEWPAINAAAPDTYAGYLVFCKNGDEISDEDTRTIGERGYRIRPVEDVNRRNLYGILTPKSLEELSVYYVSLDYAEDADWGSANLSPRDLTRLTKPDDVAIPWNSEKKIVLNGSQYRAIGLSLPKITWLKQFIDDEQSYFSFSDDTLLAAVPARHFTNETMQLQVADDLTVLLSLRSYNPNVIAPVANTQGDAAPDDSAADISVQTDIAQGDAAPDDSAADISVRTDIAQGDAAPDDSAADISEPVETATVGVMTETHNADHGQSICVVPIDLLAYLYAHDAGKVEFDQVNNLFVSVPGEARFGKARIYARTIDEVPSVVKEFRNRGYAVLSETTRINEIHKQSGSLTLLVWIVGAGVLAFGVVTVISVLHDSTERKRSTLGILRVMGVSKIGVFYTVFLRATIIAILAAVLTIAVGYCVARLLSWKPGEDVSWASYKPVIQVIIRPVDLVVVVSGALGCCGIGSLFPAWRASKLDPFDAIVEGRFR